MASLSHPLEPARPRGSLTARLRAPLFPGALDRELADPTGPLFTDTGDDSIRRAVRAAAEEL
jgi:hypothetical protein